MVKDRNAMDRIKGTAILTYKERQDMEIESTLAVHNVIAKSVNQVTCKTCRGRFDTLQDFYDHRCPGA